MQFGSLLALAGFASVSLAIQPYHFKIFQNTDCSDTLPPLNVSGDTQYCSPPPEFGFAAVKVLALGPKCHINFAGDGMCKDIVGSSPSAKIPADGKCHKLPSGTETYGISCTK